MMHFPNVLQDIVRLCFIPFALKDLEKINAEPPYKLYFHMGWLCKGILKEIFFKQQKC